MKNNFLIETIISLVLIGLLVFFINPLDLLMPQSMHPLMVPLLIILFIVFAGFLWKEMPGDEREQLHKYISSRFAYFAVITALIVGIIVQNFHNKIDPWLIITICIALLAKILGLIYGYFKH
jgi:glycerol uptake facilitator-like aquaporin